MPKAYCMGKLPHVTILSAKGIRVNLRKEKKQMESKNIVGIVIMVAIVIVALVVYDKWVKAKV